MLKVLASNLFWVGYGIASLFMAVILLRSCEGAKWMIEALSNSDKWENTSGDDKIGCLLFFLGTMAFWPVVLLIIMFMQLGKILIMILRLMISLAIKSVPEVSVKVSKKDG
jgi:hypothetical protein